MAYRGDSDSDDEKPSIEKHYALVSMVFRQRPESVTSAASKAMRISAFETKWSRDGHILNLYDHGMWYHITVVSEAITIVTCSYQHVPACQLRRMVERQTISADVVLSRHEQYYSMIVKLNRCPCPVCVTRMRRGIFVRRFRRPMLVAVA